MIQSSSQSNVINKTNKNTLLNRHIATYVRRLITMHIQDVFQQHLHEKYEGDMYFEQLQQYEYYVGIITNTVYDGYLEQIYNHIDSKLGNEDMSRIKRNMIEDMIEKYFEEYLYYNITSICCAYYSKNK